MLRSRSSRGWLAALLAVGLLLAASSALAEDSPEGIEPEPIAEEALPPAEPGHLFDDLPDSESAGSPPPTSSYLEGCDPIFDDDCDEQSGDSLAYFPDPWERYNRGALAFNRGFDTWFFDPITTAYQWLPDVVERSILRAVQNLDGPAIAINDGLQLEWKDMGTTLSRFVINSSLGIAGLFDPAAAWGIERHDSDFGQTLTLAGVPSGPYVVMPVFGPTTLRDGTGKVADAAMSPLLYVFGLASFETLWQAGSSGIAVRADKIQELQSLEQGSIDFYAALRSAFYQNRQAEIWSRREHRRIDAASIVLPVPQAH